MRQKFIATWSSVPRPVRLSIVVVVGSTLVLLGLALIVLPGPFTLPFIIAGFAVLSTEFAWAAIVLVKARHHTKQVINSTKKYASSAKKKALGRTKTNRL